MNAGRRLDTQSSSPSTINHLKNRPQHSSFCDERHSEFFGRSHRSLFEGRIICWFPEIQRLVWRVVVLPSQWDNTLIWSLHAQVVFHFTGNNANIKKTVAFGDMKLPFTHNSLSVSWTLPGRNGAGLTDKTNSQHTLSLNLIREPEV